MGLWSFETLNREPQHHIPYQIDTLFTDSLDILLKFLACCKVKQELSHDSIACLNCALPITKIRAVARQRISTATGLATHKHTHIKAHTHKGTAPRAGPGVELARRPPLAKSVRI